MKRSEVSFQSTAKRVRRVAAAFAIAMFAASPVATVRAGEIPAVSEPTDSAGLSAWAMRWFTEMMAGRTDRSQYATAFASQVTDAAVAGMAHDLNEYGAAPLRAEIVQTRKDGDQTFAIVKFVFPRGDATSLLFGFDTAGKITGVAVGGIAGD
ncbi:hypothetical protein [uncultured Rhodoblastus sp.]|uniref:hypothetical protein n=1 Tax=uncultured Rhodoblastus sp. TaxID=543037 RepID=UPI0025E9E265|nr:hypothetical protein [uncultured Rhodoblastus sp.]